MIAQTWYQGVHRGRFLDYEPTGLRVRFPLAVVIPFRDGLMAGERFYYDLATLLRQIEVLPALGGG
jgi:predicted ester cyclase